MTRKELFLVALSRAGLSASAWARQEGGVSHTQLGLVLEGDRESARLTAKIDAFIEKHVGKVAA